MVRICDKCHKAHNWDTKCPSPPTKKDVIKSTLKFIEQLRKFTNKSKNSKLRFGVSKTN